MGRSQSVCPAKKGRNTQTKIIIPPNVEDVDFVMKGMVSVLGNN
jgi:hypothetical protein